MKTTTIHMPGLSITTTDPRVAQQARDEAGRLFAQQIANCKAESAAQRQYSRRFCKEGLNAR